MGPIHVLVAVIAVLVVSWATGTWLGRRPS